MQTDRDAQIVGWIGGLGAASAEHVMYRFGMCRSVAYERLNSLSKDRLLEHRAVLFGRPGMYSATNAGLRWRGLDRLGVYKVSPGGFEHAWQVAEAAVELYVRLPGWQLLSERELRAIEADSGELYASVQVGSNAGQPRVHRPDLVLVSPSARVLAVEVEMSVKSASRLAEISRGWARARHIDRVYYLAASAPARAVKRAVRAASASERVNVLDLEDYSLLSDSESAREEAVDALA
ncbi:MAG TPA: hypothetical protein VHY18_00580 [Solirubrobacteraceae bacterium]|jgi:hypothetical protein|nr:hypothetical protein [Solirubrobacteraceae bacterium]